MSHSLLVDDEVEVVKEVEKELCDFCEKLIIKYKLKEHYTILHEINYHSWEVCKFCRQSKDVVYDKEILVNHLTHCEKKKRKGKTNGRNIRQNKGY